MSLVLSESEEPPFLTIEQALDLQREAVEKYGGEAGLRDLPLLESAVMGPRQTFGGEYVHPTLEAVAAAYWMGLSQNHPFVDGNKRVGLFACDVFLLMSGYELTISEDQAIACTLKIVTSKGDREELRAEITELIRQNIRPL